MGAYLDQLHRRVRSNYWLGWLTVVTRVLLAIGFMPSGLTKLLGNRFTLLGVDNPIGFFFEALYQTGIYWQFIGLAQLTAAILLLIPLTATLGAILYFPIILNIFIVTVSLGFQGTSFITGPMLLASIYLLGWDYDVLKNLMRPTPVRPSDD